ncbi:DUF3244 domain-containing protein [Bacteroides sp. 51]|uniref:DUF3244 domain-containing protein n=1 Tax=Bacteroides sp. 51 TaxID=2302938 RepID=UPI0013D3EC5C|nr:DUF3244 domain-containing protein [Bacteroides sp. 51]NDV82449.1 DUF3244 domain-containing protein [Bacteroides sp. 51]
MKKLYLFLFILVISNLCLDKAFCTIHEVEKKGKASFAIRAKLETHKSKRSLRPPLLIEGYIDGNDLIISFTTTPPDNNISILIVDDCGNTIYNNNMIVIDNRIEIAIDLNEDEDITYYIEMNSPQMFAYGSF